MTNRISSSNSALSVCFLIFALILWSSTGALASGLVSKPAPVKGGVNDAPVLSAASDSIGKVSITPSVSNHISGAGANMAILTGEVSKESTRAFHATVSQAIHKSSAINLANSFSVTGIVNNNLSSALDQATYVVSGPNGIELSNASATVHLGRNVFPSETSIPDGGIFLVANSNPLALTPIGSGVVHDLIQGANSPSPAFSTDVAAPPDLSACLSANAQGCGGRPDDEPLPVGDDGSGLNLISGTSGQNAYFSDSERRREIEI